MQELEKSLNFILGGVFLCLMTTICFVAFSAVTVNVSFLQLRYNLYLQRSSRFIFHYYSVIQRHGARVTGSEEGTSARSNFMALDDARVGRKM
jgi:hypothetical protein